MFITVFTRIFAGAIADLFYFPVWWYTVGAKHAIVWCAQLFMSGNATLAPGLWFRNIFVPMFGQYDIQGRIISFLMRFFQVIARLIALIGWMVVCLALFFVWLALPVAIVYGMIHSKTVI